MSAPEHSTGHVEAILNNPKFQELIRRRSGFAWTLSIGVLTSVFTAVLITQVLLALWFRTARPKTLPIS